MLEYASIIWDPHTANLSNEIDKVQRRAVRFVTSDYYNFEPGSITHHPSDLGWQSLKKRREANTLIYYSPYQLFPCNICPRLHVKLGTCTLSTSVILPFSHYWNGLSQPSVDLSDNANAFVGKSKKFKF